jgi:hypothetical protein
MDRVTDTVMATDMDTATVRTAKIHTSRIMIFQIQKIEKTKKSALKNNQHA